MQVQPKLKNKDEQVHTWTKYGDPTEQHGIWSKCVKI